MSLTLYFHPLSSFCQKVLIALYENDTPFTPRLTNLGDEADRKDLLDLWPVGRFPVLRDESRGATVPESSIIIEFLQLHYPGPVKLIPEPGPLALQTRLRDRFCDLYVLAAFVGVAAVHFGPILAPELAWATRRRRRE